MPQALLCCRALMLSTLLSTGAAAATDPLSACEAAAASSEQAHGLPAGLLAAIGQIESGRTDPATGRVRPWPYTIDVGGEGSAFSDATAAELAVRRAQAEGHDNIDVGCFQVNLLAHPQAFRSLHDAFDPASNADFAAAFLEALHARTGSWPAAVASYHSATPAIGEPYRDRVLATWAATPALAAARNTIDIAGPTVWTPAAAGAAPVQISFGQPVLLTPTVVYLKK